jgi:hypothetical protein
MLTLIDMMIAKFTSAVRDADPPPPGRILGRDAVEERVKGLDAEAADRSSIPSLPRGA